MICEQTINMTCLKPINISDVPNLLNNVLCVNEEIVCMYKSGLDYIIFTTKKIIGIDKNLPLVGKESFTYTYINNDIRVFSFNYDHASNIYKPMQITTENVRITLAFEKNVDITPLVKHITGLFQ